MFSKWLVAASIGLSSFFIPSISLAANTPPSVEVAKDLWLDQMLPMFPPIICKGFLNDERLKKRFDELKMTYDQCVTYIPEISTGCKNKVYAEIPATVTGESAATWGRALGECIGKGFAEKYLVAK